MNDRHFGFMTLLIVTNGDTAAELLAAAGRDATILPWRDVLHEGPIIAGDIERCSAQRAEFLACRFGTNKGEIGEAFTERDIVIRRHADFDRIELWFEHDLYDQLQLTQILSFLSDERRRDGVSLVQADDFLGHQRPDTILRFAERARPVDGSDLELAARIWADLCAPSPEDVVRQLDDPQPRLPFVEPALRRLLEELPGSTGLSRTEAAALALIRRGIFDPFRLFREVLAQEAAAFMGDLSFFAVLDDLGTAETPLIESQPKLRQASAELTVVPGTRLTITEAGNSVLAGQADHVRLNGVDRWWAGTRLLGCDVWCFDRDEMALVPPHPGAA